MLVTMLALSGGLAAARQAVALLMGGMAFELLAADEEDLYNSDGMMTSELLRDLVGLIVYNHCVYMFDYV